MVSKGVSVLRIAAIAELTNCCKKANKRAGKKQHSVLQATGDI